MRDFGTYLGTPPLIADDPFRVPSEAPTPATLPAESPDNQALERVGGGRCSTCPGEGTCDAPRTRGELPGLFDRGT